MVLPNPIAYHHVNDWTHAHTANEADTKILHAHVNILAPKDKNEADTQTQTQNLGHPWLILGALYNKIVHRPWK